MVLSSIWILNTYVKFWFVNCQHLYIVKLTDSADGEIKKRLELSFPAWHTLNKLESTLMPKTIQVKYVKSGTS
jgi:hypothetical protein